MKNVKLILTALLIAATVGACSFTEWDEITSLDVSPTLFKKTPRVFPGGNVDCSQLNLTGYLQTTGRNDYNPSTDSFTNGWPSGLLVKVDNGKSVSFQIDGAIDLGDGKCYKIGAVIVKGSNASNVYDYTDIGGATMDRGLVSPNNASGSPAGLSNLTFCFIECKDKQPVIISLKALHWAGTDYYTEPGWYGAAASAGEVIFTACPQIGSNYYPAVSSFAILNYWYRDTIGNVTVTEINNSLVITATLKNGGLFDKIHLYAGSLEGLLSTKTTEDCPDYDTNPLWLFSDQDANSVSFTVPYN